MSEPHVRGYRPGDLDRLYEICVRTADSGGDASALVDDQRLYGSIYAAPYGLFEPDHAFVIDDGDGSAVGYVLGVPDSRSFEERCERDWWPSLRQHHPIGSGGSDLDELLIAMIHHPHTADDDVVATHPSHLHIDLLPEAQGNGWGRRLMEALFAALRASGSPGVHLGVSPRNERAVGFYRHLGFTELSSHPFTITLGLLL